MQKSIGKSKIQPPCKIVTHEDLNLKLGTWLRRGRYPPCNFGVESVQYWWLPPK